MEIAAAVEFLGKNHRSVLITRKRNGDPQPSPVTHGVDDEGRIMVSSRERAYKVRNLQRDPRATLCAFTDGFYGEWVTVAGTAKIIPLPEAMELLVEYYRRISGEHPDWNDYRAAMERDRRVMIAITPIAAGPDVAG